MEKEFETATYTALAIVAETDIKQIQQIRQKHDPAFQRWPPHINIVFPFVHPRHFDEIAQNLEQAFSNFEQFNIKFTELGFFGNNGTVFLVPDTQNKKIHDVYNTICHRYPILADKRQFTPHMTVGKFKKGETQTKMKELQFKWDQWNIKCKGISILSRGKDTPMKLAKFIKFKSH